MQHLIIRFFLIFLFSVPIYATGVVGLFYNNLTVPILLSDADDKPYMEVEPGTEVFLTIQKFIVHIHSLNKMTESDYNEKYFYSFCYCNTEESTTLDTYENIQNFADAAQEDTIKEESWSLEDIRRANFLQEKYNLILSHNPYH